MSDFVWETFDGLFKAMYQQDRRIKQLEARIAELERYFVEHSAKPRQVPPVSEMPAERAA